MSRVLIIDDDEQILSLVRRILEREGHEVLDACDGNQGTKLCRQTRIDLVITDIIMPEKEGLETIIELKRALPGIKIIAISGGARIEPGDYLNMAAKLGAQRTLTKPFNREDLLQAVRDLLE